jgi:DNA-binding GntR family transcriptional regulator
LRVQRWHARSEDDLESATDDPGSDILREQVYQQIRTELMSGRFAPGQKLTIRGLAAEVGTSLTPVREALYRLSAEGAFDGQANRSVRVPVLTGEQIRELRDIRMAVEGLAVSRAAPRITAAELRDIRRVAARLKASRAKGDFGDDMANIFAFHQAVYRASGMPALTQMIETLWLRTGPYLRLLYPEYIASVPERRGDWRERLCAALERHDAAAARDEIERDLNDALSYLAQMADAARLFQAHRRFTPHG